MTVFKSQLQNAMEWFQHFLN